MIVYRTNGKIEYNYDPERFTEKMISFLSYIVGSYGFVLNTPENRNKPFTFSDFGEEIAKVCSLENTHNKMVYSFVKRLWNF